MMSKKESRKKKAEKKETKDPVKLVFDEKSNSYKDLARKFYEIMKNSPNQSFVNCYYLHHGFDKSGFTLKRNPFLLWRVWRQAEHDFPSSITFVPNTGWRYNGPPQYDSKRRKRLK